MYLIFCIWLFFLLWHRSDTNMQECIRQMVISITNLITGATLSLVGIKGNSFIT